MSLQEAAQYRKIGRFQKAVQLYYPFWNENHDQFGAWDGWSYAYCLFKTKKYEKSLNVCRVLYRKFKTFDMLRSLYARSIYCSQFKRPKLPPLCILKKATLAIYELSDPKDPYSVTPRAIFSLCKEMMAQKKVNWQEIEKWLLKMQPDLLDDQAFKMKDSSGKEREIASAMEQWYAMMLRVKAGTNNAKALLDLLSEARKRKLKWHYNNDIWFSRKEAFAYQQLGNVEKAEQILRRLVSRKKDWFLTFDLAKIVSNEKEKFKLLCIAALAKGKPEMKIKLYESLYDILKKDTSNKRISGLHLCLIVAIREENNWEVNHDLLDKIKASGIEIDKEGSSSALLKKLFYFWKKHSGGQQEKRYGVITHILPNGKSGFIESDKQSFYFTTSNIKGLVSKGMKVTFLLRSGYDKKKRRATKIAISVSKEE